MKKAFEDAVWKTSTIWSRPHCVQVKLTGCDHGNGPFGGRLTNAAPMSVKHITRTNNKHATCNHIAEMPLKFLA